MVAGLIGLQGIRKEVFPSFPTDTFTVTVPYPGSSPEEIEQAVFLYSSRGELPDGGKMWLRGKNSVRVLSDWERLSLCSDCYGYLLRLLNLGIVDGEQFEKIIARAIPVGQEKIQLNDVKAIVCSVIFNRDPSELEDELFDNFDEDIPAT